MTAFDAIVLAGGRASRLGGTPKPGLLLGGTRLLDRALAAVSDAAAVAVVGPHELADGLDGRVILAREDPPFGGPAAGIEAGLRALDRPGSPDVVVLLAVDVPGAGRVVPRLLAAVTEDVDGACLAHEGQMQWLVSAVRRDRLLHAIAALRAGAGSVHDQPVRRLVASLRLRPVPDEDGASDDVDTWDDLARLEARHAEGRAMNDPQTLLAGWVQALERELDLPAGTVDVGAVLDLTRDAAHNVARPAGPIAAYAAGYARALADVAAGAPASAGASDAVERAAVLARGWTQAAAGTP